MRHLSALLGHCGTDDGTISGMVHPKPADFDSRDGCGRPIRPHDDRVLFQRYGRYQNPSPWPTLTEFTAVFRRSNRSRSRRLSAEPALARIRAERISSWPTGDNIPSSVSQGHDSSPGRMRQVGPGMAGIGANRPPRENNALMFSGPSISHPPPLQPRHHRSRSSGGDRQQGWIDDSIYNGPGYQPRY